MCVRGREAAGRGAWRVALLVAWGVATTGCGWVTARCGDDQVACDGQCIDWSTDPAHCGASGDCVGPNAGRACSDSETCSRGVCWPPCRPGFLRCDGACINPQFDPRYCGAFAACERLARGTACTLDESCVAGACVPQTCPEGTEWCAHQCIDPQTDERFCGGRGNCALLVACGGLETCVTGTCINTAVATCNGGRTACGNSCFDLRTDTHNCGACDAGCPGVSRCQAGECVVCDDLPFLPGSREIVPRIDRYLVVDTNRDGLDDVVNWSSGSPQSWRLVGAPSGFLEPGSSLFLGCVDFVEVLDVDADGKPELLVETGEGTTSYVLVDGGPATDAGFYVACLGDWARGYRDIYAVDSDRHSLLFLEGGNLRTCRADATGRLVESLDGGPMLAQPSALSLRDLDGDGVDDLLWWGVSGAGVRRGLGGGEYGAVVTLPFPGPVLGVAVGDHDGDGRLDMAAASAGGAVRVAWGAADGGLGPLSSSQVAAEPLVVAFADLDGDHRDELLVGSKGAGPTLFVIAGPDAGALSAPLAYLVGTPIDRIQVVEGNLDHHADLLLSGHGYSLVSVVGNGSARLPLPEFIPLPVVPSDLRLGDFDCDGMLDALVHGGPDGEVGWLRGQGAGGFGAWRPLASGAIPRVLFTGDLDRDGTLDLLVGHAAPQGLGVTTSFVSDAGRETLLPLLDSPTALVTGDFDRDAKSDAVVVTMAADGGGTLVFLAGDGQAGWSPPQSLGVTTSTEVATGDFDRNGWLDVVALDGPRGQLTLYRGTPGGPLVPGAPLALHVSDGQGLRVADLDADGFLDVVVASPLGLAVIRGDGLGGFVGSTYLPDSTHGPGQGAARGVAFADFDRDGALDVVSARDAWALIRGRPSGAFESQVSLLPAPAPSALAVGDLDRDGRMDLVMGVGLADGGVAAGLGWWLNPTQHTCHGTP